MRFRRRSISSGSSSSILDFISGVTKRMQDFI
jgi:hypothetical protein